MRLALCPLPVPHILYQIHHKYTAYCVFPFTRKRLPAMLFQTGISIILLKLLIEEERIVVASVADPALAAVVIRAA
jgi:hypothetical protein